MTTTEILAEITQAIENAKADLDKALLNSTSYQRTTPSAVGFVAHAMNSYLTITDATVSLLTIRFATTRTGTSRPGSTACIAPPPSCSTPSGDRLARLGANALPAQVSRTSTLRF